MKVYDLGNTQYNVVTSVGDYKLLTILDTDGTAFDGTNQSFNLKDGSSAAVVTSAGQLIISVNGVIQKPNAGTGAPTEGFALVDSDTIIFSNAPGAGASVFVTLIGAATSVNVPATNSIVEAAIQTNVVSEEKLKIGNSPTNGKFLQAQSGQSGGLYWETVTSTPEGTAILSTGETGGTKFLREDGDNSCSWQSVPVATPTAITVADESTDTTCFPLFSTAATGDLGPKSGSNLTFNSNTGALGATSFTGDGSALTGVAASSADGCMYKNTLTISNNHTIAATEGAHSVGPITNNATVTVNGRWVIN
jgi:hypothetical protein